MQHGAIERQAPACLDRHPQAFGHALRRIRESALEIGVDGLFGGFDHVAQMRQGFGARELPVRTRMRPGAAELVVASALKPSPASTLALPASHGFGSTKQPD